MEKEQALRTMAALAAGRRAVLFIGSGATKNGGGATWQGLATDISGKLGAKPEEEAQDTFDILCTSPARRAEVYGLVQERLRSVHAPPSLVQVLSHPWPAVFTTNYDTAIEDHYRQTGVVVPRVYLGTEKVLNVGFNGSVPVLKVSGSMNVDQGQPGEMVLTRTDRERHRERTGLLYDHLTEITSAQAIISIGYSYRDEILFEAIQRVRGLAANSNIRVFALFPEEPEGAHRRRLEASQVEIVRASMDELATALSDQAGLEAIEFLALQVGDSIVHVPGRKLRESLDAIEPVTGEIFESPISQREFLLGETRTYKAHVLGHAWQRPQITETTRHLDRWTESGGRALLVNISGRPGSGRTVTSYALAAHLVRKHNFFAARNRPGVARLDVDASQQLCEAYREATSGKEPRLVVQCDEQTSVHEALYFLREMTELGRARTIVLRIATEAVDADALSDDNVDVGSVLLADQVEPQQASSLAAYIARLPPDVGAPTWTQDEIDAVLQAIPSFVEAMYSFVHPFKKTFKEIMEDEVASLQGVSRSIVEAVALPTLGGSEVPVNVLAKVYQPDYGRLFELLERPKSLLRTSGPRDAPEGVSLFHRRVADALLLRSGFKDAAAKEFQKLVTATNLTGGRPHDMASRVLVRREGRPSIYEEFYGDHRLGDLWHSVDRRRLSKLLLHHMGLTYRRLGKYDDAISALEDAVRRDEGYPATDRPEIVETSLVHARWQKTKSRGIPKDPEQPEVASLRLLLSEMRSRTRWNPHAYVIEANILLDVAEVAASPSVKMDCIALAQGLARECIMAAGVDDESASQALGRAAIMGGSFTEEDAERMEKETGQGAGWYVLYEARKGAAAEERRLWLGRAARASKPSRAALRVLIEGELKSGTPDYPRALTYSDKLWETFEGAQRPRWHDHLQRLAALVGAGRGAETRPHVEAIRDMAPHGLGQPVPYFIRSGGKNQEFRGQVIEKASGRFIQIGRHGIPGIGAIVGNPENSRFKPRLEKTDPVAFELGIGVRGFTAWDVRLP